MFQNGSIPVGYYCDSAGQHNETDLCDAGYYCVEGAWRPDPNDNVTGGLCPTGHYCPRGTYDPVPCPAGYYSNMTGAMVFEDCKPCSAGTTMTHFSIFIIVIFSVEQYVH